MLNNSENHRITMVTIGEKLRQARDKKSLTIDQARKQTHIHSSVLIALEEGRCDDMLTSTYVKSFLKKYAAYLGLDSNEIMTDYLAAHPEISPSQTKIEKIEFKSSIDLSKFISIASSALIIILSLIVIIFLGRALAGYIKKSAEAHRKPVMTAPSKPKKEEAKREKQKAPTAVKESGQNEKSDKKFFSKISIPKDAPLNLAVKVRENVTVQVKKDGVVLFRRSLSRGSIESIKADNSINVYVTKLEAVDIILNGKTLDLPVKGLVKDLEITRKSIRIK